MGRSKGLSTKLGAEAGCTPAQDLNKWSFATIYPLYIREEANENTSPVAQLSRTSWPSEAHVLEAQGFDGRT